MNRIDPWEELMNNWRVAEREFQRAQGEHTKNLDPLTAYTQFGFNMPPQLKLFRMRAIVLWHWANTPPIDKRLSEIAEFLVWYHESNMSAFAKLADVMYLDKSNRTMPHVAVREGTGGMEDFYRRFATAGSTEDSGGGE